MRGDLGALLAADPGSALGRQVPQRGEDPRQQHQGHAADDEDPCGEGAQGPHQVTASEQQADHAHHDQADTDQGPPPGDTQGGARALARSAAQVGDCLRPLHVVGLAPHHDDPDGDEQQRQRRPARAGQPDRRQQDDRANGEDDQPERSGQVPTATSGHLPGVLPAGGGVQRQDEPVRGVQHDTEAAGEREHHEQQAHQCTWPSEVPRETGAHPAEPAAARDTDGPARNVRDRGAHPRMIPDPAAPAHQGRARTRGGGRTRVGPGCFPDVRDPCRRRSLSA